MAPVNFASDSNEYLINPRMPLDQAERLTSWLRAASGLSAHVFVLTSGSTAAEEADYKWVALSKQAVISAAQASNQFLNCHPNDLWVHALPDFHVGGLGIWARALLSGSPVVKLDPAGGWGPRRFVSLAEKHQATLSSLVPTQLHDIVAAGLHSPGSLRAVLVGGAALSDSVYEDACALGWPVLRTYGMSETASQVATEPPSEPKHAASEVRLQVLPHLEVRLRPNDARIEVRGSSLFTGYVGLDRAGEPTFWDPKDLEGWFTSEDVGAWSDGALTVLGREGDRIKVGGEVVNLGIVRRRLDALSRSQGLGASVTLVAVRDARLESVIALVADSAADESSLLALQAKYNEQVLPFERARLVLRVSEIPRTELGKIKWAELSKLLPSP